MKNSNQISTPKPSHGGVRGGAGRKATVGGDEGSVVVTLRTSKSMRDKINARGGSEWMRHVLEQAMCEPMAS